MKKNSIYRSLYGAPIDDLVIELWNQGGTKEIAEALCKFDIELAELIADEIKNYSPLNIVKKEV